MNATLDLFATAAPAVSEAPTDHVAEATARFDELSDCAVMAEFLGIDREAAFRLHERFRTLTHFLAAEPHELRHLGLSSRATQLVTLCRTIATRAAAESVMGRPVITAWSQLLAYVRVALAGEQREQFRVLFLDKKNQLIADEVQNVGTTDHAPVYPREVIRRALILNASAVILVHNHPSGDPTPSSADVEMTRQVVEAGRALRICVHDHLVVGAQGVASMKSLGLF